MLVFGILMIAWALTRPLGDELVEVTRTRPRRARGTDAAALASDQRSRRTRRDSDRTGGDGDAGPQ